MVQRHHRHEENEEAFSDRIRLVVIYKFLNIFSIVIICTAICYADHRISWDPSQYCCSQLVKNHNNTEGRTMEYTTEEDVSV